ncbi:MAG: hypothetical protein ACLPLZ_07655 [Terracidiphilus sp.]
MKRADADHLEQVGDVLAALSVLEDVRAILSVVAIEKGLRTQGRFLVNYSEAELLDIESRA